MIKERAEAAWASFVFFFPGQTCSGQKCLNALGTSRMCWEERLKSLTPKPGCCQVSLRLKFELMFGCDGVALNPL